MQRDIQRLKADNPIEAVAARYASLQRSGANYKMLCPFHDDHHPSLHLHVAGQYFKCHACGAGGDVISLLMGLAHCSFAGALKILGGNNQPGDVSSSSGCPDGKTERMPEQSPNGQSAAGLPDKAPAVDRPGKASAALSPADREERAKRIGANVRFLSSLVPCASGHSELSATWLDFGVSGPTAFVPDDYHYLRGRIVFPIYNAEGELTGFGGRRAETADAKEPKYKNSPNSLLFDKSRMLYGIHRAAGAIRDRGFAYLTEGYKDALAMHAAGFTNTVALGGTAFTPEQAVLLCGFCDRAVLLLDNDAAGQAATARLLEDPPQGLSLSALRLTTAKDADELFRRLGREGFCRYMGLLTVRAGAGEKRLLAFCLKHPEVAPHVERMLEEDDLGFTSEAYRNLLHFTALLQPASSLPLSEKLLVEVLSGILPALSLPAGVPASLLSEKEETVCHELAEHFRLEYYEERILGETSRLTALLKAAELPADTTAEEPRSALLTTLSRHISLLVRLTESLSRTPAVDSRWL